MTCIAMQNGIILADRQTSTSTRSPCQHDKFNQEFEYVNDGTDKLIILPKGSTRYRVTDTESVRVMAFSGNTENVPSMMAMMENTTLEDYQRLTNAAEFQPFMATVSGYTQSGKVFFFRSQEGKARFAVYDVDDDLYCFGSGNNQVIRLNDFAPGSVRTPLEAMVLAYTYDPGTGMSFDCFNIHTSVYTNCVILSDKQRDGVLRRIESRFKLNREPARRVKVGFRETADDYYVKTIG